MSLRFSTGSLTFAAETELLKTQNEKPNFAILLLQIVASDAFPANTRLSSALFFKNYIKYNYTVG